MVLKKGTWFVAIITLGPEKVRRSFFSVVSTIMWVTFREISAACFLNSQSEHLTVPYCESMTSIQVILFGNIYLLPSMRILYTVSTCTITLCHQAIMFDLAIIKSLSCFPNKKKTNCSQLVQNV